MTSKTKLDKLYYLFKSAGKYYVNETSDIIKQLNSQGESALVGIQNKKGIYTIIGRNYVYYLTASGKKGKIPNEEFTEELNENGRRIGTGWWQFTFRYKNIILKNTDKVWLHHSETMFALLGIMIWMKKNKW
ncbi:hypothetical protein QNI19_16540 [Cytophagaceae bacterium DM2B3-1]|uniref:Uncharacterized protein n=1 Tax=Xanthocytophaga flava TaxID=3048013 RepID=A0ABT7CNH3_9BACT|nr:hypothetical protein [Xanthocytophaga flavus]MDJ1494555.1 hypothetical protein [Xanthocytophaga flavus]